MKKYYIVTLLFFPCFSFAQLKQIAFAELTAGSGMYFGAEMSTTTITVTLQGPSDRYLGFGFGSGMESGNDAIIWSTTGTGAQPLQLRDHYMTGVGVEPSVDAQQDWTVVSNTVSGGNRTIVASRALNTGDANDVTFNFSATSQALFWAKAGTASNTLAYHGGSNRADGIIRNWVLVDQTPPSLSSTSPADNAVGVGLTQNLVMTFSENISWGTGSINLYTGGGTLVQSISNGSPGVFISGATLNWNPAVNFNLNTDYYVQIDPTAVKDAAGNFYAGITDNTTWNFNTNDVVPPALAGSAFNPADNATGVALATDLSVTFNEAVQLGTGTIQLYLAGGTIVESFDVTSSAALSVAGNTVTINPSSDLVLGNDYYVTIDNDAIRDLTGNAYTGFSNATTWNFSTYDIVPPSLLALSPPDNSTGLTVNPTLQLTFNEPVDFSGTGTFELHSTASLVESFSQSGGNISVNGAIVTLNLSSQLAESTDYYIIANGTVIADTSGNAFSGLSNTTDWNFSTGDFQAPLLVVSPFSPADDAINVAVNSNLQVTFNEPVILGTGDIVLKNDQSGSTETFNSSQGTVVISGSTITLTPAGILAAATPYHIEIAADAVTDLSANAFAGFSNATAWNFTTLSTAGLDELDKNDFSWNGETLQLLNPEIQSVSVYSTLGKLIRTLTETPASLSDFDTGVYLLAIHSASGTQVARIYVR